MNEGTPKHEGGMSEKLKKGVRIIAMLGALGATVGKAEAADTKKIGNVESSVVVGEIDADAQGDALEALGGEFVEQIMEDGKITPEEAETIRFAWDELKPMLPAEMTTGETGVLAEDVLSRLEEMAGIEEELARSKAELTIKALKLSAAFKQAGFGGDLSELDPYAEGQAVEYVEGGESETGSKTADEIESGVDDLMLELKEMTGKTTVHEDAATVDIDEKTVDVGAPKL